MNILRVGGFQPFTTIDYPGELAAVVFCQGCPWRCRYCHNRHLLSRRGSEEIPWSGVLDFLHRRAGLLDAVVFSGGEPTLQRGLPDAIREVRVLGFKVGLHTAGCYPKRLAAVLPMLDWVGLDIKALPEDYPALTGVLRSGEQAWQSLRLLLDSGIAHEVRITIHPTFLPQARLMQLIAALGQEGALRPVFQKCQWCEALDQDLAWRDVQNNATILAI
ncbi:MAG: anaerobic ribonucleoside-triphosphate reductase activating protein [Gammaproteobacteria bacterium RIFOXYA12_FULL_61_12]|nr:MAG: anaerobic ribonucleoside-triphosphate reductase activating protein [Gammaproteobacteria bacterium RIFOXYD12_FULL_61_37]OGT93745.1 MAG: anaerobic ribonucleoside-triphosphate reductase activating protein [Gammaproteobacteria bacterium RIFOXYA12_FULL_61_12]